MSGIVGILNLNGSPVDSRLLTRMTDALAHRGPDGIGYWAKDGVGMGHLMFCTTPEAEYEKQPWTDESGKVCLAFDGRIDNRKELTDALNSKGFHLRNDTDAEIVLQSYLLWQELCAEKIIGDFAFAIWDGRKRRLYCARDIFGIRPLFYYYDGTRFVWGSEIHQFFVDIRIPKEPNEGRIGEFLTALPKPGEETLFRGIYRLPIAHYMVVGRKGLTKVRYWNINPDRHVKYSNDDEYAEHFLQVFNEAVLCRLRSNGPVGAELSGGLDSSSVVSVTQSLLKQGKAKISKFETFSQVFPGLECDESTYIHDVINKWGLQSNLGPVNPVELEVYTDISRRSLDFPDHPVADICNWNSSWWAHGKGFKVMLTGVDGDSVFGAGLAHYTDLLRSGRWYELAGAINEDRKADFLVSNPLFALFKYGLKPLIPQSLRTGVKRTFYKQEKLIHIDPKFAESIHLRERMLSKSKFPKIRYAQRPFYDIMIDGWNVKCYETTSRMQAWLGYENRHPILDRRLVEFCLALPYEQRRRGNKNRYILRNAMKGLLPESVKNREDKGGFSHMLIDTLEAHGGEKIFSSLAIAKNGWVDQKKLCETYQDVLRLYSQNSPDYDGLKLWQLWCVHGIDLWWRASFAN